jgi:hypothetical protein
MQHYVVQNTSFYSVKYNIRQLHKSGFQALLTIRCFSLLFALHSLEYGELGEHVINLYKIPKCFSMEAQL